MIINIIKLLQYIQSIQITPCYYISIKYLGEETNIIKDILNNEWSATGFEWSNISAKMWGKNWQYTSRVIARIDKLRTLVILYFTKK